MNNISKALCFIVVLTSVGVYGASDKGTNKFLTFTFENDLFVGRDDGYTNGTGITVGKAGLSEFSETNVPPWIYWLIKDTYINDKPGKSRAIAHMFFQRMQTPLDITVSEFIPDDLPYAGLLAWQGTAYSWDEKVSDQMSLFLGWLGPAALAEQAQSGIHKVIGSDDPRGWDFQLENEPVFKLEFQRSWSIYRSENRRFQYEVVGLGGFGFGNLLSATKVGIAVRWGTNLESSIGAFSLQADRHVNPLAFTANNDFYIFVGARAGYVVNDILIDGNTFRDSPSIPLEHTQNEAAAGVLWSLGRYAFVFSLSSSSSRTELNDHRESHGAFSVTYRY